MEDIRHALARIEAQLARPQVVPEYHDKAGRRCSQASRFRDSK